MQWNGGWPIHLTSQSPRIEIDSPALDTDQPLIQNLRGRTYMAAVSPWFFTVRDESDPTLRLQLIFFCIYQHYGPKSWNKNVR